MNLETDWQIINLYEKGNGDEAFEAFIKKYKPSLYSLCYRMMQNTEDAAEAWQEVLLQINGSLQNFKNESSLYTWAYRIALNVCLNLRRRLNREAARTVSGFTEIENFQSEKTNHNQDAVCQDSFKKYLVQKTLNRLPDTQKTVLILHSLEGFTLKEIAATLGIKENAAKARLRRAKISLKDFLKNDFEDFGVTIKNASSIACSSKLN